MKHWITMLVMTAFLVGCWDVIEHVYDCNDDNSTGTGCDGDSDVDSDADGDADADMDSGLGRQGLPDGWQGFGEACEVDEDCKGYPGERRCLHDVLGYIKVPGGYCSACCDLAEIDGCGPGIDCVGIDDVYLVCLSHCEDNSDCRQSEGYECRGIYYLFDDFPGNYCLPNEVAMQPAPDDPIQELDCPWPWL